MDPDSESEAEVTPDRCEAERVGLELQGRARALASEGCQDKAAPESTTLLVRDRELSDLGGRDTARLCNHHSQLYMLSCQGRKCSVVSCFGEMKGARMGTPFCKKHLTEANRSPSPSAGRVAASSSASLSSLLRTQVHTPRTDAPSTRGVTFSEAQEEHPTSTTSRRRSSTPPPPPAEAEPLTEAERQVVSPSGQLVLVRLRPFFGPRSGGRPWYLFVGRTTGASPDSRRNERVGSSSTLWTSR